ncbi:metallophosphoesterase [Aurantiacibacter aquimixticola]|uniref:Metallophosphoesterase n=1 Tax=Aurantiacibacter aquimixticola TaxID=1958945 RepID=A0A419RRC5_9SPHN|nr:metallophosphoesterase [Aurantiacibacter aquimixticola]RJY08338.1 metallophosphoesterase [Aurantiacibacter aquimixticola]
MVGLLSACRRRWKWIAFALLLLALLLGWKAWVDTMDDPVVRRAEIALPGLAEPVTVALISDIHVAGPDMPPSRLARIVEQVNALEPDVVMIAGDLVSEKRTATHIYAPAEVVAPLGELRAPLGTVLVPGNHDHWFDWPALRAEAEAAGIRILQNEAAVIGPLVVGGVDDAYTRRDDLSETLRQMRGLEGGRLILTHSPDVTPQVPADISLVLAGHTHCGQIRFPLLGAPATMSRYGDRFACGVVEEGGKTVVTGAGLGTSLLPIRFGTRAEIWVVELVPDISGKT